MQLPTSISMTIKAALLATSCFLAACSGGANEPTAKDEPQQTNNQPAPQKGQARDNDMVLGDPDAPATIIEFASVTCGGCAAAHETIIPQIKEKLIDTGKAKLVFREYPKAPAQLVNQSFLGSVLARCAADQSGDDAYFLVIDRLLKTQREWIFGDTEAELTKIAAQAGMNKDAFNNCITTRQDLLTLINDNVKEAEEFYKITGTPSFIVNGEKLNVRSYADIEKAVLAANGEKAPASDDSQPHQDAPADDH